jgi:hypothetical protein
MNYLISGIVLTRGLARLTSGPSLIIYKDHICVRAYLCFCVNGKERATAYREQETTEGFVVLAPRAEVASWHPPDRHGTRTRQTAGICQLLRVWSEKTGLAGTSPNLWHSRGVPVRLRPAI